MVHIETAGF